jgi:hypothetical protein
MWILGTTGPVLILPFPATKSLRKCSEVYFNPDFIATVKAGAFLHRAWQPLAQAS